MLLNTVNAQGRPSRQKKKKSSKANTNSAEVNKLQVRHLRKFKTFTAENEELTIEPWHGCFKAFSAHWRIETSVF